MKRVRMLLRVSSEQQLEADGDLSIQRKILLEYISKHPDWYLDKKEYFEGSKSAYKNTASKREILQEVLQDAKRHEFDILVPYKDDRVGRLMWDTPLYIMTLKGCGVDVFTVKDGCISPESDDIMGQMMLTFRYANAQKSSADTGMRVKDTAQKLVEQGKFMGGFAPYGYQLEYSGEVSKHGRALKHLVIVPKQAEVVKYIYDLSFRKEYGSAKIAKMLNLDERYQQMAPKDVWKSSTITSILTNPIYAGHTAYKRRERKNGRYHRLDSQEWSLSSVADERIAIIDEEFWNRTQEKRKSRSNRYTKKLENQEVTIMKRNDGILPFLDVMHCGYCGCKMTNGSKYNYWTIKTTGERRASKTRLYQCQGACQGMVHDGVKQFRAEEIEPVLLQCIANYIEKLQEKEDIWEEIEKRQNKENRCKEKELEKEKQELRKLEQKIAVMEGKLPEAMMGEYPLPLEELVRCINRQKALLLEQKERIQEKEDLLQSAPRKEWEKLPTWKSVFLNADTQTKRVIINCLVWRMDIKKEEAVVHFKIG